MKFWRSTQTRVKTVEDAARYLDISLNQMISEPNWECGVEADEKEASWPLPAGAADRAGYLRVVDPGVVWRGAGVASELRTGRCLSLDVTYRTTTDREATPNFFNRGGGKGRGGKGNEPQGTTSRFIRSRLAGVKVPRCTA